MKKLIAILVAFIMVLGLVACTGTTDDTTTDETVEGLKIVTTIFPIYDWVREIMGDEVDNNSLTMVVDTGVDLHSFEPTVDDIIEIGEADIFIYNGGESDEWVEDVLAQATNEDMIVINLLEVLGDDAKMEVSVEGMQESDDDHDDEDDHDHDDEEETDEDEDDHDDEEEHEHSHEDEHMWLSLNNAQTFTAYLADVLATADEANAETYTANQASYATELASLDAEYAAVVEAATFDTILFADRFPFRYLVDDYGISYYAAFSGCSSETEASFETITFLAEKVDELGLTTVLIIDGATTDIADTVIAATSTADQEILVLDSMQSVTASDIDSTSYLEIMQSNLEVLESALN